MQPLLTVLRATLRKVALLLLFVTSVAEGRAQSVVLDGPAGSVLTTATPRINARLLNIAVTQRPIRFTLYVTRNSTGDSPFIDTVGVDSPDSIASLLVTKLLPSEATVYWKVRATLPDGRIFESEIAGPKQSPRWLTLIKPNSPQGDPFTTRRPKFVWSSAKVDPTFGRWKYDIQLLNNGASQLTASGLTDTTFTPSDELQANAPYRWQVHASLAHGEEATEKSISSFLITDPSLPTTTLLYQNFPNPFPSPASQVTCFWFDVGAGGATITLDVLDLRGNLVRNIVPTAPFAAGTYGRGAEGTGTNCSNRFVWDGTANDGRTIPRGVYLLRFIANSTGATYKKIVFNGR